ncbi:ATP-grasp ribosomal peptide maturase [Kitasatospora sp. YST-16]|uniref:ATP-grasp ribosomal peptide maturase n=1 Tax=Kitasatospora sp. YST-16 TaxID=2998080 RepID=UPI0022848453|nr:ATP-grasp ribosomal peptide maturase [Kitasatospora sp. YST-16]WAL73539.1 ATP-grasp ribosomal peptide maturase [Kitasatospora sp. YST-16]WNW39595.1 ATP-grasp ribosomal peptide maturase [Streptomyces sp. Li-HN-5-13]
MTTAPHGHVLIVAEDLDPSADLVVHALAERGVPVMRFDLARFPRHLDLAAEHGSSRPGWFGELAASARSVRLEEVRAVYYRRPGLPETSPAVDPAYREWAQGQALVGMVQVLGSLPVVWMHHPDVYRASAHKPGQLVTATAAGLRVPRTLVTNSLPRAERWADSVGGPLIVKPVTAGAITLDGRSMMLPTRRFDPSELDESLELTAHLLQEWVPKAFEVRLTVVGDQMFPVAIHSGSSAAEVDWRSDYDALEYEPVAIPDRVADGVRRFLAHYRLNYGALDFAVTSAGEWVFFECNPAGQWQFIAAATKLPIAEAHAALLQGAVA